MGSGRPKYRRTEVTRQITLGQSAVRLVVVHAWLNTDGLDTSEEPTNQNISWEKYPVVALALLVRDVYEVPDDPERKLPVGLDRAGMIAAGWKHKYEYLKTDYLVPDEGTLTLASDQYSDDRPLNDYEIVVADWPSQEDNIRLWEVVDRMRADLLEWYGQRPQPERTWGE